MLRVPPLRFSVVSVELRPPRAELEAAAGIDAWIDTYHAIRGLVRQGVRVMVTDSAVGAQEENNLRHLVNNLGPDVPRDRVVPFLTTKHSVEFCLAYADQVVQHDFPALVVLGGDKHVGRARSVEHAWQLRQLIRQRHPDLPLGGWANPAADPVRQVAFVGGGEFTADFYLTPDRLAPSRWARSRRSSRPSRPGRRDRAGHLRRVLLPQRQAGHARRPEPVPAGAGRGAAGRVRRRRHARWTSARARSASCARSACGTSTSATCR